MRTILHVIETTGPGGAETVFVQLATQTSREGLRHVVALPGPGWVESALRTAGTEPFPVAIAKRSVVDIGLYRSLVQLIRAHDVDLVHSHTLGISTYACLAGLRTRTPVICTLHGDVDLALADRRRAAKFWIIRRGASKLVLVSEYLRRKFLDRTKFAAERVAVVHNGVDAEGHSAPADGALRREFGLPADAFLVGAVGNIRGPKAYDNLLRAAAIAARENPALRFVVVGEGSGALLDELLRLRAELGLEGIVHFAGFRDGIASVLANFDAFVLSSSSEGFSIATVQAMASALPVVATRSGGPEEIVTDGVDGLLVPVADPSALAAALVRISRDSALRERLGAAARATALSRFSLRAMLARYEAIYREALGA
jgi:glycosyltransferase involved in cell wall biosynthesis